VGGPQNQSGHTGKEKNFLLLLGVKPQFLGCPAHSLVTVLTMQSQLQTDSAITKISVTSYMWFHLKYEIFATLKMRLYDKLNVVYFEI